MWKNNSDGAESDPGVVKKIVDEILDEKLSDAEKEGILDSFCRHMGGEKRVLSVNLKDCHTALMHTILLVALVASRASMDRMEELAGKSC